MSSRNRLSQLNYYLAGVTTLSAVATILMAILSPIALFGIRSRLSDAENLLKAIAPSAASPYCASGCGAVFTTCEADGDCTGLAAVDGLTLTSTCNLDVGICIGTIELTSVGPQPGELGNVLCKAALNTTNAGCFTVVPNVVGGQVEECRVFNGCASPSWPTLII